MKKKITNATAPYHAPLPEGRGVLVFEFRGRPFKFQASGIDSVSLDSYNDLIIMVSGKNYDFGKDLEIHVIDDMYFRALRGEIARYAEYNEQGLRIDGTLLLIMEDYAVKEKLAEARRQKQQPKKFNLTGASNNAGSAEGDVALPMDVDETAILEPQDVPKPEHIALAAPELSDGGALMMLDSADNQNGNQNSVVENLHDIGALIEGKGVYVGTHTHEWKKSTGLFSSEKLSRIFDVYAAPKDVKNGAIYSNLLDAVAGIENLEGHSGARIETEFRLKAAIENDEVEQIVGQWFVPSFDILKNNVHVNRGQGALASTFQRAEDDSSRRLSYYAALRCNNNQGLKAVSFRNGVAESVSPRWLMSVRPVRMELRK
jgi:hypothetical protein